MDPFTLFQPPPAPPTGIASWIELQTLAADRASAHWAAEQVYWARFGAWTQLAAFVAAGAAAWFTWKAAQHSRVQAEAAQDELRIAREGREAESRVRAFELLTLMDEWFLPDSTDAPSVSVLRIRLDRVMRAKGDNYFRQQPRREIREEGVRIAAGIRPASILLRWIKLFDDAERLREWERTVGLEVRQLREASGRTDLVDEDGDENQAVAEPIDTAAPSLPQARAAVAQFWSDYDAFRASVESIGRAGAILAGNAAMGVTATATLTSAPAGDAPA